MINIHINKNHHDQIDFVSVDGHAEFADYGYDIVCSAISAITITIVNGLKDICHIKEIEVFADDGLIKLFVPEDLAKDDQIICEKFLKTLELGYLDIASNYPDNVKVIITEEC